MKAIDIENLLKTELVGKSYDSYGYTVGNKVIEYLANNGFDRSKLMYDKGKGNTIYIAISAPRDLGGPYSFITIEVKKAQGAYHRWGYDWNYKDFLVTTYNHDTVEESCKDAVAAINARKKRLDDKLSMAQNIFQMLKDAGYSEWDAEELVKTAADNRYTLASAVYRPDKKY